MSRRKREYHESFPLREECLKVLLSPTGPGEDVLALVSLPLDLSWIRSSCELEQGIIKARRQRAPAALLAQSESDPRRIGPDARFRQQRLPEWHGTGANIDARPIRHLESSRPAVHPAEPPGILRRPRRQTASGIGAANLPAARSRTTYHRPYESSQAVVSSGARGRLAGKLGHIAKD